MPRHLTVSEDEIAAFCRRNHSKRLAVFGSVAREDFGPESDVDVLYELEEGHVPGYDFVRIHDELAELVGRDVDMVSYRYIYHRLRDRIFGEAQVVYEAA